MKAMSKQELADCAGVNARTLGNWLKPFQAELTQMGMTTRQKVLPPNIVAWIAERLSIDIDG